MKRSFQGEVVHYARDALGSILVIDYRKHRVLTFDSIFEQSKIERRRPYLPVHEYNRAMLLPLAFTAPRNALVLGLGGGVLVNALYHLAPGCGIHAVELRGKVVEVAREFFRLPVSDTIQVTVGDARQALDSAPDESADLILADLYNAGQMSPAQARREFVDQCSRVLGTDGWLVINFHRTPDLEGPLFRQMRLHFAALHLFRSKTNNFVIYAGKRAFTPRHPDDPILTRLEERLPVGWRKLMGRVIRVD